MINDPIYRHKSSLLKLTISLHECLHYFSKKRRIKIKIKIYENYLGELNKLILKYER